MSKSLIPVGRSVDLRYECPKCETEIWLSEKEASVDGFKIVCGMCGAVHQIEAVEIKVRAVRIKKLAGEGAIAGKLDPALSALTGLYKVSDIQAAVRDLGLVGRRIGEPEVKDVILQIEKNSAKLESVSSS